MRTSWLVLVVASACGGGSSGPADAVLPIDAAIDARPIDARPIDAPISIDGPLDAPTDGSVVLIDSPFIDAPSVCNALTQTGCTTGEKCTWIQDQDNPPIGHVGCAPDGNLAIGAACTDPPAGPQGYDTCVRGSVCLSGECKQICDNNGGAPSCDAAHACTRYADIFEVGGTAVAGVCDPGCDPLTQRLLAGTVPEACGSVDPSMPTKGCYGYDDYSCAPAGMSQWPLTDRMPPRTNASGNPYLNGCAPGFIPFFYTATGSTVTLCTGFCGALEVDNTPAHVGNVKGNAAALAKLPLSPAAIAGDGTCDIGKKGSHASSTCKFIYPYVTDNTTGMLPIAFANGPLLDTLGVCQAISFFQYDSNNDFTPDAPFPDCATLPVRSIATPGDSDDAADWGCQKFSNSQFVAGPKTKNPALFDVRIGAASAVPLLRHTFN